MADGEQRANKCSKAKFGPNYNNKEFALVDCAAMATEMAIGKSAIHLDMPYSPGNALALMEDIAQKLASVCEACELYEEGTPTVCRPLSSLASVGKGSDGEYYGGDHPEWTDAPTTEAAQILRISGS
jgi:hypothetical protein